MVRMAHPPSLLFSMLGEAQKNDVAQFIRSLFNRAINLAQFSSPSY